MRSHTAHVMQSDVRSLSRPPAANGVRDDMREKEILQKTKTRPVLAAFVVPEA
jgi:hypothetical protein